MCMCVRGRGWGGTWGYVRTRPSVHGCFCARIIGAQPPRPPTLLPPTSLQGGTQTRAPGSSDQTRAPGSSDQTRAPGSSDQTRAPGSPDRERPPGSQQRATLPSDLPQPAHTAPPQSAKGYYTLSAPPREQLLGREICGLRLKSDARIILEVRPRPPALISDEGRKRVGAAVARLLLLRAPWSCAA